MMHLFGKIDGVVSLVNQGQDLDDDWNISEKIEFNSNLVKLTAVSLLPKTNQVIQWTNSFIERETTLISASSSETFYRGDYNKLDVNNVVNINQNQSLLMGVDIENEQGATYSSKPAKVVWAVMHTRWINPVLSTQLSARYEENSNYSSDPIQTYNVSMFRNIPLINVQATGTLKTGFRVPTLYEESNKSADLAPETSKTYEVSLAKTIQQAVVKVTYFDTYLNNKIGYDLTTWTYANIEKSTQQGVEYAVDIAEIGGLSFLTLAYSDIQSYDNNQRAIRVPDYKATLTAGIEHNNWTYGAYMIHEGDKLDVGSEVLSSYTYVDLKTRYAYDDVTSLFVKIHNVFNEQYETAAGFNEQNRTVYVGIKRFFN